MFFSGDSENMRNNSADQLCFKADQYCSETEKMSAVSDRISSESVLFSADLLNVEKYGFQR